MATLNDLLLLIAWGGIGALIVVLYRIARFYQLTSGRVSYYRWFVVPLLLLIAAAVMRVADGNLLDLIVDSLLLLGSASLIGLGYSLLRLMTGSRS